MTSRDVFKQSKTRHKKYMELYKKAAKKIKEAEALYAKAEALYDEKVLDKKLGVKRKSRY